MAYVPKNNTGSLFKNDRKDSDRHPDYTGSIIVDGVSYWLSAWVKEGQRGKFFSMAVKPKDERAKSNNQKDDMRAAHAQPQQARERDALDDEEIPF